MQQNTTQNQYHQELGATALSGPTTLPMPTVGLNGQRYNSSVFEADKWLRQEGPQSSLQPSPQSPFADQTPSFLRSENPQNGTRQFRTINEPRYTTSSPYDEAYQKAHDARLLTQQNLSRKHSPKDALGKLAVRLDQMRAGRVSEQTDRYLVAAHGHR